MTRIKLFKGLFGCSFNGILYTPKGKYIIKLPPFISFKLHAFINTHLCNIGMRK